MMLINQGGMIFVARRIDTLAEAWQMPQGGIDAGEEPKPAALRELKEEIGTDKVEILGESREWLTYDLPDELIPKIWGGKYRGQKQKWFAMRFLGEDRDIDIATEHPEFSTWKWVEPEEVPKLIVPFKRALYEHLIEEFRPLLYG